MPDVLGPAANEARARLLRLHHGRAIALPPPGRTVLRPPPAADPRDVAAIGFAPFDGFALRVDVLERLAARVRALARLAPTFTLPPELAAEAGITRAELAGIVGALAVGINNIHNALFAPTFASRGLSLPAIDMAGLGVAP